MAKLAVPLQKPSHQLRIIGGQWRGRKLTIANVDGLRPTGDRIRETLFNWLMNDIVESRCLDLFSGSGALGLECLSRGAKEVLLLEKHPLVARQLRCHCEQLGANNGRVIESDSLAWLNSHSLAPYCVDIAFIDPPFAAGLWTATIENLNNSCLLKEGAIVYIEMPRDMVVDIPVNWQLHRQKQAGQVSYYLYRQLATDSLK